MQKAEDNPIVLAWQEIHALNIQLEEASHYRNIRKNHVGNLNSHLTHGWRLQQPGDLASLATLNLRLALDLDCAQSVVDRAEGILKEAVGGDQYKFEQALDEALCAGLEDSTHIFQLALNELSLDGSIFPNRVRMIHKVSLVKASPAADMPNEDDELDPVTDAEKRLLALLNVDQQLLSKLIESYECKLQTLAEIKKVSACHESLCHLEPARMLWLLRSIRALIVIAFENAHHHKLCSNARPLQLEADDARALINAVNQGQSVSKLSFTQDLQTPCNIQIYLIKEPIKAPTFEQECIAQAFEQLLRNIEEDTGRPLWRCTMPQSLTTRLEYLIGIRRNDSLDCGQFYIPRKNRKCCGRESCVQKHKTFADSGMLRIEKEKRAEYIVAKCERKHKNRNLLQLFRSEIAQGKSLKDTLFQICQSQKPTPF